MPSDRALLTAHRGTVTATVNGRQVRLGDGDEVYVSDSDRVVVARRSSADLTFRGGAVAVLCAGSTLDIGTLISRPGDRIEPTGALSLVRGRLLVDTRSDTGAFNPLALTVDTSAGAVVNDGAARYTTEPATTDASRGAVTLAGSELTPSGAALTCGDGVSLPLSGTPSASPSVDLTPSPSDSASASSSASASTPPTGGTTTTTTTRPPTPGTSTRTTVPPVDRTPPTIVPGSNVRAMHQQAPAGVPSCGTPIQIAISATVTDASGVAEVWFSYFVSTSVPFSDDYVGMTLLRGAYRGQLGPFPWNSDNFAGGTISVTIYARDRAGNTGQVGIGQITLYKCQPGRTPG
jgi:putative peptide zinc metalloprotease protein